MTRVTTVTQFCNYPSRTRARNGLIQLIVTFVTRNWARVGVLAERRMLMRGGVGNLKVEKVAGTSERVYVITPPIFDGLRTRSATTD